MNAGRDREEPPLTESQAALMVEHRGLWIDTARRFWRQVGAQAAFARSEDYFEDLLDAALDGLTVAVRGYDPARGAFSTYAVPMMRGYMLHLLRARGRREGSVEMMSLDAAGAEWEVAARGESVDRQALGGLWVRQCLAGLRPDEERAIRAVMDGYDEGGIAAREGVPASTVKGRIRRGRDRVRARLWEVDVRAIDADEHNPGRRVVWELCVEHVGQRTAVLEKTLKGSEARRTALLELFAVVKACEGCQKALG